MLKQKGLYVTPKEVARDYLAEVICRDLETGLAEVLDSNPTRKERIKVEEQIRKLRLRALKTIKGAANVRIIK